MTRREAVGMRNSKNTKAVTGLGGMRPPASGAAAGSGASSPAVNASGKSPDKRAARIFGTVLVAVVMMAAYITAGLGNPDSQAHAATAGTAVIPVSQTVTNGSGTFDYTLTPEDDSAPMPDGTTNGSYTFSATDDEDVNINITSSSSGVWYYTLTADDADSDEYSYNVKTYKIGVAFVYGSDGFTTQVTAIATDPRSELKAAAVDFAVTFAEKPEPAIITGDPGVEKKISGDNPQTSNTFEFTLAAADEASAEYMPEGSAGGKITTIVTNVGTSEFGEIEFDKAGTYTYNVSETQGSSTGFTYDKSVYQIQYVVSESTDSNALNIVKTVYTEDGKEVVADNSETAVFTNAYEKPVIDKKGVGDPGVTKQIDYTNTDSDGNEIEPDSAATFYFTLQPLNNSDKKSYPMPQGAKNGELTISVDGEGSREFGDITFTSEGTYWYKVTEKKESKKRYTYDTTVYKIKYDVTEGSDKLDVVRTIYRATSSGDVLVSNGTDNVTFTNKYAGIEKKKSSSSSNNKKNGNGAKTGDMMQIGLYLGLLIVSLIAVIILLARRRKERKQE